MGWRKKFMSVRDRKGTEVQVGEAKFVFYPNRIALLTEARDLFEPVAKAVSVLFADESKDNGSNVRTQREGDFFLQDVQTQAIDIEMAKHRQLERDKAIEQILTALSDDRAKLVLGKLLMDSLRDEFPYAKERSPREVEEFLYGDEESEDGYEGLDMPTMVAMFKGWMKGNAKVFGQAGEKMVGLVRNRLEVLQHESLSEEEAQTSPTPGNSSKTASSQESAMASQPNT